MSSMMRKRGWSIHSEGEHSHTTKQSIMTEQSEDTLTDAEKLKLLQNFPSDDSENKDNSNENEEDVIDMFGSEDDDDDDDEPSVKMDNNKNNHNARRKRQKTGNPTKDETTFRLSTENDSKETNEKNEEREKLLEAAKGRLSTWAARLFDPDRPRGIIEPPQVIPLNDEFLKAFGKREKEFDDKTGRIVEIDKSNLDDITDDENDEQQLSSEDEYCNVKVVNLAYTTTKEKIMKTFQRYGVLVNIDLVPDPKKPNLSLGRATLTYESQEGAEQCVEKMNQQSLDGRVIFVSIPNQKTNRCFDIFAKGGADKSRYWVRDISTRCFRCGQVGHVESNCVNEAKPKACPLCGKFDHESRSCPFYKICFNCGVPGHVNRDCPHRRGLPKRMACGLCFRSGHHRWNCSENLSCIPTQSAKCLVCGKLGHFMCTPMRWFFGLKGISCFNCGRAGHHGMVCDRPNVEACNQNSDLALNEIQKAEAMSLTDEISVQGTTRGREQNRQGISMQRNNNIFDAGNNNRNRAKSLPPNRNFQPQNQKSSYGQIQTHRRFNQNNRQNGDQGNASTSRHGNHDDNKYNNRGYNNRVYQDNFNNRQKQRRR